MKTIAKIGYSECKLFFLSSAGAVLTAFILAFLGTVFYELTKKEIIESVLVSPADSIVKLFLTFFVFMLVFLIPLLCVRSVTDDLQKGNYKILILCNVPYFKIVLGKYFGIMLYFFILVVSLSFYLVYLSVFASFDFIRIIVALIGLFSYISALVGISMFVTVLSKNVVVAFLSSFLVNLFLLFSSELKFMPNWFVTKISLLSLGQPFIDGVLNVSAVITFIAITLIGLSLTKLVYENRKWRF